MGIKEINMSGNEAKMEYGKLDRQDVIKMVQLFEKTFTDSEGEQEGKLISKLSRELYETTDPESLHVFVSKSDSTLTGCIIFTPLYVEDENQVAFLLSPVAVHTAYQARGIGQRLISHGLAELREQGCTVAVTYGDIRFYSKVGFSQINESMIKAPLRLSYPEGWLAQRLDGKPLTPIPGETKCVKALADPVYW